MNKQILRILCLFSKYVFFLSLNSVLFFTGLTGKKGILCALAEVLLIFILTNLIYKKFPKFAWCFNSSVLFVGNAQNMVLLHGSSFISLQMLTNLHNLYQISGHAVSYIVSVLLIIVFSFLPITAISFAAKLYLSLSCVVVLHLGLIGSLQAFAFSPFYNIASLLSDAVYYEKLKCASQSGKINTVSFYKQGVGIRNAIEFSFKERPNLILIFTEGLSESIIHDKRNIMPNTAALENNSLHFANYYNHTFATYMGLSGQLHSGYQRQNLDDNFLPSLQSILKTNGYKTCFINTEPKNSVFSDYLRRFKFDAVITKTDRLDGLCSSLSDKDAYDLLYETSLALSDDDAPFFVAIYTFGTHVSFNSTDRMFLNGADRLLNPVSQ